MISFEILTPEQAEKNRIISLKNVEMFLRTIGIESNNIKTENISLVRNALAQLKLLRTVKYG